MLVVVAVDANDQLFPIAFAIVEGENNDSWGWFMSCSRARVARAWVAQREELCVISDRHKRIITTMNDEYLGWRLGERITASAFVIKLVTFTQGSTTRH